MTLHINTPPHENTPEIPLLAWLRSHAGPWFLTRDGRLTVSLAITVFLALRDRSAAGDLGVLLLPIVVAYLTAIALIAMPSWHRQGYVLVSRSAAPAAFVFLLFASVTFVDAVTNFGESFRVAARLREAKWFALAVVLQIPVVLMARRGVEEMKAKATHVGNTRIDFT